MTKPICSLFIAQFTIMSVSINIYDLKSQLKMLMSIVINRLEKKFKVKFYSLFTHSSWFIRLQIFKQAQQFEGQVQIHRNDHRNLSPKYFSEVSNGFLRTPLPLIVYYTQEFSLYAAIYMNLRALDIFC